MRLNLSGPAVILWKLQRFRLDSTRQVSGELGGLYELSGVDESATGRDFASLTKGRTYLPVYSHVYHLGANRPFYLPTIVSIRNVSLDTSYILQADYYNTEGDLVRSYLEHPILVKPLSRAKLFAQPGRR